MLLLRTLMNRTFMLRTLLMTSQYHATGITSPDAFVIAIGFDLFTNKRQQNKHMTRLTHQNITFEDGRSTREGGSS